MNAYRILSSAMRLMRLALRIMRVSYKVRHQSAHKKPHLKSKRNVWASAALSMLVISYSCDAYHPSDNAIHVGYVLCDDHSCLSPEVYFAQSKHKGVGVVFAEQTEEHPMMAVMLSEVHDVFCDSLGLVNGTSGSLTAFDGVANTRAMQNSFNSETGKGSPLAMQVYRSHQGGQSDFIPSVAELRLLVASVRKINPIIERLKGTPIALEGDCWYWTSTEVNDNKGSQAWLCSAANGGIIETPKTDSHKARAIVQLNYGN